MSEYSGTPVESGDTSQKLHFLSNPGNASNMVVYQKRGTGSWTLKSTPAIAEDDATHAPGAYSMTMNQDMTIASGKTVEEIAFFISGGNMAAMMIKAWIYDSLKVDQRKVIGSTLVIGGSPPASPIGF